jgi:DNA-binding MarR family transcriptional regulator
LTILVKPALLTAVASPEYLRELEQKKRASTAQLLLRCARLLNEWALARARAETGNPNLRAAHTSLLPHLGFDGIRLTALAQRLGVSKQAAFQLVEELEAQGMVEKLDDPQDGRAKLIRFSKQGERALMDGLRVLGDIEREVAAAIGGAHFRALHDALLALMPVLEAATAAIEAEAAEPAEPIPAPKPDKMAAKRGARAKPRRAGK